jgi:hypothetical protein
LTRLRKRLSCIHIEMHLAVRATMAWHFAAERISWEHPAASPLFLPF